MMTRSYLFANFGQPRKACNGTMALNCFTVSNYALGLPFAAAAIAAFSSDLEYGRQVV